MSNVEVTVNSSGVSVSAGSGGASVGVPGVAGVLTVNGLAGALSLAVVGGTVAASGSTITITVTGGGGGASSWNDLTGKPFTSIGSGLAVAGGVLSATGLAISDVTGLQAAIDGKQAAGSYAAAVHGHAVADVTGLQAYLTKVDGIATGATANQTDAYLLARANHTGTQAAATITGLATVATSGAYGDLSGTPAAYSLPTASASTLGGVRIGAGVSIDGSGIISVSTAYAAVSHTHSAADITSGTLAAARIGTHASTHQTGGSDPIPNVVVTPSQITSDQNDYSPGTGDIVRISANAARNITGLVAGSSGEIRRLSNVGSFAITLKHESSASSAANRFVVTYSGDWIIPANSSAVVEYDATTQRWRVS